MKKAYIHIGMPKTGTSAIQDSLGKYSDKLLLSGLFHPTTEDFNHPALIGLFHPKSFDHWYLEKRGMDEDTTRRIAKKFWLQVESNDCDLVVSCEYLFNLGKSARHMASAFRNAGYDPSFVCYIRHPVDSSISTSQQSIKMGERSFWKATRHPQWHDARMAVSPILGLKENISVRDYAHSREKGAFQDFLDTIGYGEIAKKFPREEVNSGLSMEGAILAGVHSEFTAKYGYSPFPKELIFRIKGQKFTLPSSALDEVRQNCKGEVKWFEEKFDLSLKESSNAGKFSSRLSTEVLIELLNEIGRPLQKVLGSLNPKKSD